MRAPITPTIPLEGDGLITLVRLVYTEVVARVYSTYEAKAKLSEILRKVRAGQRVGISYRGELVAEVAPVVPARETLPEGQAP